MRNGRKYLRNCEYLLNKNTFFYLLQYHIARIYCTLHENTLNIKFLFVQ